MRVDQAVTALMLEAVSGHAVQAALLAAEKASEADDALAKVLERDLEAARYEASLAARRYDLVDPARRHVARELEARWNAALEKVAALERRITAARAAAASRPEVDRGALLRLAEDLPAAWNAPTADNRTRQRLTHVLVREVVIDFDDATHEAVVIVHWTGGRHTEARIARVRSKPRRAEPARCPAEVVRRLAQEWPDREIAVTLNRMRCKTAGGRELDLGQRAGGQGAPRCSRVRAVRRRPRDGGRAGGGAAVRDLHSLGLAAHPRGHAAGRAGHALRALEDPRRGARIRTRHRRTAARAGATAEKPAGLSAGCDDAAARPLTGGMQNVARPPRRPRNT